MVDCCHAMAIHLNSHIAELPGIGAGSIRDFKNLGITTVHDLLMDVPFRYDDYSCVKKIAEVRAGETVTVVGMVQSIQMRPAKNRRMKLVEATIVDETGELSVVWFNQDYLIQSIRPGMELSLAGTVDARFKRAMVNPLHEPPGRHLLTGRLLAVYRLSGSLKNHRVRTAIRHALQAAHELKEWLPDEIMEKQRLPSLTEAITCLHVPPSREVLDRAILRLKFDELFLHQLMYAHVRHERAGKQAHALPIDEAAIRSFVQSLPFTLTPSQRRTAWEVLKDMAVPRPMNRLLQGDVGCGKTVVAAIAAAGALTLGKTVVYLAPTELLCVQQHRVFCDWFRDESVALYTRTRKQLRDEAVNKSALLDGIGQGSIRFVVGTHALFESEVPLAPALLIVDEQHRFGVAQRHALFEKTSGLAPHFLSMTATPIPRSLALTLYGDLDLSTIREMPKGRRPVASAVVPETQRAGMWRHVRSLLEEGKQAFVICPLIDPSDALGAKSVLETRTMLEKGPLQGLTIETLHGKLKADEREALITKFRQGGIDVLVSTTVVEVGVDIPNAAVMVITAAERFGLAQLHQLRGRVGRSDQLSYCYLLSDQASGPAMDRLRLLETVHDGFALAEHDLRLRGSGNFFGTAQSGFPDFTLATEADVELMHITRECAREILSKDPELTRYPLMRERVCASFDAVHLE